MCICICNFFPQLFIPCLNYIADEYALLGVAMCPCSLAEFIDLRDVFTTISTCPYFNSV